mmetsp:Transcript_3120/g.4555  ORF Transcript_3120/g.4555 Transcript_3120/m.4555 type:complete len:810 (-) Transcript_3120:492-2921(-)|eukprot:CAMPEP_0203675778 /NCGR_PEP_ID=MMETSP0090-20130426/22085_1 /ASSEMBLY_ACC=CAM_ASM_001088 /TAXON_ID=426623 /ORGANISM="Chaetoceros affinis, Strain CCMP159" /LENGTH=809 /DNA_ID=CAMNT_0050542101 /DNA_START=212 /DNA_END=2641 /DNA_ORIENTATION=+
MVGLQDNGEQSPSMTSTPTKRIRVDSNTSERADGKCHNPRDDDTATMSLVEEEDDDGRMAIDHKYLKREGDSDVKIEAAEEDDRTAKTGQEAFAKLPADSKDDADTEDEDHDEGALSSNNDSIVSEEGRLNSYAMPPSKKLKSKPISNPKKSRKLNYIPSKLGRKGDPRMHRALKARLDNPKLSLLDALTQGGFEFHWKDGISYDSDNVQLGQRKNQLSRRLRLYKQNQNHNKVEELEKRVNSALCKQNQHESSKDNDDNNDDDMAARKRKVSDGNNSGNDTFHHTHQAAPYFQYRNDLGNKDNYGEIMKMMMSQMSGIQPQCTFQPNNFDQSSFHYQNRHDFYNVMKGAQGREPPTVEHVSNLQQNQQQMNPFHPFVHNFAMNSSKNSAVGAAEGSQGSTSSSVEQPSTDPLSKTDLHNYQQENNTISMNNSHTSSTIMPQIPRDKIQRLHEALNLYRIDSSALMKRCMLSAGFTHQETEECDEMYVLFGELAVQGEQKRIGRIRSKMSGGSQQQQQQQQPVMMPSPATMMGTTGSPSMESMLEMINRVKNSRNFGTAVSPDTPATTVTNTSGNNVNAVLAKRSSSMDNYSDSSNTNGNSMNASKTDRVAQKSSLEQRSCSHSTNHKHHDNSSVSSQSNSINTQGGRTKETANLCVNQHIHRLEGKCGHRAIIHKPADGNPHIDFVVDGKIECYENCQPMMSDSTAFWFSKFKCDKNHNCHDHDANLVSGAEPNSRKGDDKVVDCMNTFPSNTNTNDGINGPKILDFNELNFDSNEWKDILDPNEVNPNNPFIDEEVLGSLFKLGEKN